MVQDRRLKVKKKRVDQVGYIESVDRPPCFSHYTERMLQRHWAALSHGERNFLHRTAIPLWICARRILFHTRSATVFPHSLFFPVCGGRSTRLPIRTGGPHADKKRPYIEVHGIYRNKWNGNIQSGMPIIHYFGSPACTIHHRYPVQRQLNNASHRVVLGKLPSPKPGTTLRKTAQKIGA